MLLQELTNYEIFYLPYFAIDPSKQLIFFIDIGVIAHAFPKMWRELQKNAPE